MSLKLRIHVVDSTNREVGKCPMSIREARLNSQINIAFFSYASNLAHYQGVALTNKVKLYHSRAAVHRWQHCGNGYSKPDSVTSFFFLGT